MTITLPDALLTTVQERARRLGFASADEYVASVLEREFLEADEAGTEEDRAALDRLLIEGLESGQPIVADAAFWTEKRRILAARTAAREQEAKP